ncbi:hypothetical protein ACG04R_03210 [Roseateles sp. BYS78W]|uniref:Uncharacterized protein n=1 Tax=Pelomonas candidula TaxID=3299025 RepID=A0ABW7H7B9_9BURK
MKLDTSRLRSIASIAALSACTLASPTSAQTCAHDVAQASEIDMPPPSDRVSHALWTYAANYSPQAWRVSLVDGRICADTYKRGDLVGARPAFKAEADGFRGASRFARVADGWLVAFNHGEFGAALYWFSTDGTRHYRMSENQLDPQVVDFFALGDELGAIQGLNHMLVSRGSIIRIVRDTLQDRWRVDTAAQLPAAPYAIAVTKQGESLVVLSDSLVAFDGGRHVDVLAADMPWSGLYPTSAVLSPDEKKLYIGMRQFVGEFDLSTRTLRFLLPSGAMLNRLSKQQEEQIRAGAFRR